MDMKKTAKKIAALVAGTTMLGATIMGATALDLSNYPAPFVTNGVFSGKIVVGAKAATTDVVGAIDLAASLQAAAKSSAEVDVPGAAGEASVMGDAAEFKTGSDVLAIGETLANVKQTFTANDLAALKSGVLDTGVSSTPTKQYLKFDQSDASVVFEEDSDSDKLSDYLKITDGDVVFEYHLEFTEGAESDISTAGALDDFENEVVSILGAPFTITNAALSGTQFTVELLGGQVADVLRDGETKTYTIDGKDYEVTAVFISDSGSAKLSVNGVMTKELTEGRTQVLGTDVTVGVQSVLSNNREGLVEFYLGANKLKFVDAAFATNTATAQTVEVKGESVSDNTLILAASNVSNRLKWNYLKYTVAADDDLYVLPGEGARAAVEENNEGAFLTDTWDIKYAGLVKTGSSEIKLDAISDHSYELVFTNVNGDKFSVPYVTNKNGVFKWGDDDDEFWFTERAAAGGGSHWTDNTTWVSDNDYFLVSDKAASSVDEKAATKVLRYQSINTGDSTITFKDLSGNDLTVSYTGTIAALSAQGELIVDGKSHTFYVGNASTNAQEDYALSIDLDGSSSTLAAATLYAVAEGGAILSLNGGSAQTLNDTSAPVLTAAGVRFNVTTVANMFDETSFGPEVSNAVINASGTTIDLASVALPDSAVTTLTSDPDNDDYDKGYSDYGAYFERYSPASGNNADELTIDYPATQRYAQVFVTAGVVEVKEGALGESGKLTTENVNPIAVGLAVLDTDAPAVGTAKMIVVGGPCANTVAAELMGNQEDCTAGFTAGKATIKLFADKNALLVAGYSADDTKGATYVLGDYEDYMLKGTEVEVVTADLKSLSINVVE